MSVRWPIAGRGDARARASASTGRSRVGGVSCRRRGSPRAAGGGGQPGHGTSSRGRRSSPCAADFAFPRSRPLAVLYLTALYLTVLCSRSLLRWTSGAGGARGRLASAVPRGVTVRSLRGRRSRPRCSPSPRMSGPGVSDSRIAGVERSAEAAPTRKRAWSTARSPACRASGSGRTRPLTRITRSPTGPRFLPPVSCACLLHPSPPRWRRSPLFGSSRARSTSCGARSEPSAPSGRMGASGGGLRRRRSRRGTSLEGPRVPATAARRSVHAGPVLGTDAAQTGPIRPPRLRTLRPKGGGGCASVGRASPRGCESR